MKLKEFEKICVLGLGYIGLPTAGMFATNGINVVGVDVNVRVVEILNRGGIHIEEVGLAELVNKSVANGKLVIQSVPEEADAFIIAVPTPIKKDKSAEMKMVRAASEMILPFLKKGDLVVLESTSPPDTTEGLVKPILEKSGLVAGKDFYLVYSPERVLPGKILYEMVHNSRIVGGINTESAIAGRDLYLTFVKGEIALTTATTAEMVKLMENTFRDVNIALANEFAKVAEKLNVNAWEAIELANRHPRVNILKPGPGVGGHCIAVDPWFLVESAPDCATLIRNARLVNDAMPAYVANIVKGVIEGLKNKNQQPIVSILGLAYKADVDDARESPAWAVIEELESYGYQVKLNDPFVKELYSSEHKLLSFEDAVTDSDCLLLLTDHSFYTSIDPDRIDGLVNNKIVVDTRNHLNLELWSDAQFSVTLLGNAMSQRMEISPS
jgi:UDP-N-acetyl-D-mannosaminuronic acid dehydrogenase